MDVHVRPEHISGAKAITETAPVANDLRTGGNAHRFVAAGVHALVVEVGVHSPLTDGVDLLPVLRASIATDVQQTCLQVLSVGEVSSVLESALEADCARGIV